jgi:chaperonin cofactor prefoldin
MLRNFSPVSQIFNLIWTLPLVKIEALKGELKEQMKALDDRMNALDDRMTMLEQEFKTVKGKSTS